MSGHEITSSGNGPDDYSFSLPEADDPTAPTELPQELLEFHSPSAALINTPPSATARYMGWLVSAMVIASVAAMSLFPLDRVVSTTGRLTPADNSLVVQPFETSIIRSIDVHEGDYVHKGQIIAHLDPTITDADVENMRLQAAGYKAEVDRLTAEAEDHAYQPDMTNPAAVQESANYLRRKSEYDAKVSDYDHQIAGQQSALQQAVASAAMYAARARVAGSVLTMRENLQRDHVGSRLSTLSAQDQMMEIERSQISSQQEAAEARSKISALTAERDAYIQSWKADIYQALSTAQHRYQEAAADSTKATLRKSLVVMRADRDALVLSVAKLSVGSVLSTADKLMTLVPVDSGLEVEAILRGSDAGFVQLGDKAILKFATFPYAQYGGADAVVRVISADAFSSGDPNGNGGSPAATGGGSDPDSQTGQLFYRVRMRVDRYTLHGVPSFFHPRPGMPVTADIKVGKRTIMQYLFNRMIPVATDGMREP
ncbi:major facilitator superfamily multidrug resistance transporter EmrA/FusE [Ameyamaea chiangmaiensis NBRC 103196]|uniref:Membrane fusion protein (MFP) family protein n=1 Tax=Ameyamaea chiangmaiensis TaxID=442969 RepID=A0A850PFB0_9PROT|nr:HlyD family type I secretion periplasmic adaptor subunit [Ameyamaea chiangmaiensis]MBS4075787.1 HlyD family type I secretion periplasmic adaptor subunit [Ameyamaea chiangmaiensis]NVN41349.1 HlyD family type I secretion periplasmic adaptor subunit [Ameyamaea chiangmaiensis]GBQ63745.1 major facilitator superfamily multidrug resistance transporter EmrA/FusE [Ameyamaea chiangmaiensis NBRC 103196]